MKLSILDWFINMSFLPSLVLTGLAFCFAAENLELLFPTILYVHVSFAETKPCELGKSCEWFTPKGFVTNSGPYSWIYLNWLKLTVNVLKFRTPKCLTK